MGDEQIYQDTREFPVSWLPTAGQLVAGRFQLRSELHAGSHRLLWTAVDLQNPDAGGQRLVVLKMLPPALRWQPAEVQGLLAETSLLGRVSHPGICGLVDAGLLPDRTPFLVFPYVASGTVRDHLRQSSAGISWDTVRIWLQSLVKTLEWLHQAGVVHADLKPENLLVSAADGGLQLIDFGLARELSAVPGGRGTVCRGTPAYMSPEQWSGVERLTSASDVWSLAVLVWELLTGRIPRCRSGLPLGQAGYDGELPELPVSLRSLQPAFMAAWRIVPQQRLHSVTTFFESLQRLLRVPAPPRLLSLPFSPTAAVQTQATWSDWLQLPPLFRTPHGLDFILIPCGEYLLGSADDAGALQAAGLSLPSGLQLTDELPQRHVSLSQPFYIQRGCVTVGQFAEFVAATGYRTECERNGIGGHGCGLDRSLTEQGPSYTWRWPGFRQTREHPVVNVTPSDCLAFADWISSQTAELRACGTLRLPSEAEWEYCCRAGTVTRFPSGAYPSMAVEEAFGRGHNRTSADILSGACRPAWFSAPVLLPWPNPFGLQGLLGTVWQWCSDVSGPASAVQCERMQVQRGGSWALAPRQLRSSLRRLRSTAFCCHRSGFRLILELRASGAFQR